MTCPTCLRPQATEADAKTWKGIGRGANVPDNWPDEEGDHLCWAALYSGSTCEPPEWWAAVTPLEVWKLHAENARLTANLNAVYSTISPKRGRAKA